MLISEATPPPGLLSSLGAAGTPAAPASTPAVEPAPAPRPRPLPSKLKGTMVGIAPPMAGAAPSPVVPPGGAPAPSPLARPPAAPALGLPAARGPQATTAFGASGGFGASTGSGPASSAPSPMGPSGTQPGVERQARGQQQPTQAIPFQPNHPAPGEPMPAAVAVRSDPPFDPFGGQHFQQADGAAPVNIAGGLEGGMPPTAVPQQPYGGAMTPSPNTMPQPFQTQQQPMSPDFGQMATPAPQPNPYGQPQTGGYPMQPYGGAPMMSPQGMPGTDLAIPGPGKQKLTTLLLCLFLGIFGAHRFYTGWTAFGIIQFFTLGGCGVWAIYDLVMIATGKFRDAQGNSLVE